MKAHFLLPVGEPLIDEVGPLFSCHFLVSLVVVALPLVGKLS